MAKIGLTLPHSLSSNMKIQIDHNSSTPLHIQAELLLRELIKKKEYQDGKLLPNEVELSMQLRISRNTLRHAISKLVNEGILTRKKGFGTTVSTKGCIWSRKKLAELLSGDESVGNFGSQFRITSSAG